MILTCPSCGTRYVVKDGAIPPAGRTVRCAQCKHSWHQDPDPSAEREIESQLDAGQSAAASDPTPFPFGDDRGAEWESRSGDTAPPSNDASVSDANDDLHTDRTETPSASMLGEPETAASMPQEVAAAPEPYPETAVPVDADLSQQTERESPAEDVRSSHPMRAGRTEADDVYSPFATEAEDGEPRRKWPMVLGILLVVIAALAAAIYFLAPTELKGRLGLAQSTSDELMVQIQQNGRTQLASGNQLFEVSGVVRNETDKTVPVPPLNARLRSLEQKVVYSWTIAISPQQLAPGASASFNSANLDVPSDAACLELYFDKDKKFDRCKPITSAGA
ncbi:MJ0042-type zinc finger domain-containing protein [Sphingomonas kaistensis]|uniref:MJ0042-type zinc finger domain-containing protein n=1 Tax=Sphingomonas kaistensis TaxID=298708 RepID=A0ABZ2G185_9SPHN